MTKQTFDNWLKPFRQQQNHTQESLANALHIDIRTISRWENHVTVNNIPYDKLANVLETDEQTLKDAHEQGLIQHKNQQANKKPINENLIIKALEGCLDMGLTEKILIKLDVKTIEEAAETVDDWLQQGNMLPFRKYFNQLIKDAVDTVEKNTITDLDLIEQLIGHIALSATIPNDSKQLDLNQTFNLIGVKKAWSIRLMIDASIGSSMTGITAISSTELKWRGGVKIEESTKDNVWQAAHKIIKNLVDEIFMEKEPFPELVKCEEHENLLEEDQYSEFSKYCKGRVTNVIDQTNYEKKHCFLYSLQQEPEDVQQRILMLLDSIRVFKCSDNNSGTTILRLNEEKLEAWVANALYAIQTRREQIKPDEGFKMKTKDSTATKVYLVDGGKGGVTMATEGSTITQLTYSPDTEQLITTLKTIQAEIDLTIPEDQQLRVDVNEILNELNKNGRPPAQGEDWLKDGLEKLKLVANLKAGTGLITLLEKAAGLCQKL